MKTSPEGIALIKSFESCKLHAYPDPATGGDPWTIGVGHTGDDVFPGLTITEDEAESLLRTDLIKFERCVSALLPNMAQAQFDACVSLAFNIGCDNFRKSTVARKASEGDDAGAADAFLMWNKGAGHVMAGLTRRREAEKAMFLS